MKKPSLTASGHGFSLVELLVVIAVIAIIAAIAIPNIANITSGATDSTNRRNAQNFASVASAAIAAGYSGNHTDVDSWIGALTNGVTVTNNFGQTNGIFKVEGISDAAATGAKTYLTNNGANLVYNPNATN